MASYDYMKIINAVARMLANDAKIELLAAREKINGFTVNLTGKETQKQFEISLSEYSAMIRLPKKYVELSRFDRWLIKLEFELEQVFVKNIEIKSTEEGADFIIAVSIK